MPRLTPADRRYRKETLRITDLAVTDNVLRDLIFEECHIIGPAILGIIQGGTFDRNDFDGSLDEVIWEVPPEREKVLGIIGLVNCEFYGCRFTNIGLAMTPELAVRFRDQFDPGPDQR